MGARDEGESLPQILQMQSRSTGLRFSLRLTLKLHLLELRSQTFVFVPRLQKQNESHLFKWIDEALLDEIRLLNARYMEILHDFQALKDSHEEFRNKINEKMRHLSREIDDATRQMKE